MSDIELKFKTFKFITLTELIKCMKGDKVDKKLNELINEFPVCINLKQKFFSRYYYHLDTKFHKVEKPLYHFIYYDSFCDILEKNINTDLVKIGLTERQYNIFLELINKIEEIKIDKKIEEQKKIDKEFDHIFDHHFIEINKICLERKSHRCKYLLDNTSQCLDCDWFFS